jgi:hypothetical protein
MEYTLVPRKVKVVIDSDYGVYDYETRFDICDLDGNILDDAQGHGYKSAQGAHRAAAYKFKGGAKKAAEGRAFWQRNKDLAKHMEDWMLINFKTPPSDEDIVNFAKECGVDHFDVKLMKYLKF